MRDPAGIWQSAASVHILWTLMAPQSDAPDREVQPPVGRFLNCRELPAMTTLRWLGITTAGLVCLSIGTGSPGGGVPRAAAQAQDGAATFGALDQYFRRSVEIDNKEVGATFTTTHGPYVVVRGFDVTLFAKNGRKDVLHGPVPPFDELKAVSHIGPCLFFIGKPYWRTPDAEHKRAALASLRELRDRVRAAAAAKVDWSNPAWAGQEDKLRQKMDAAMAFALRSIDGFIAKGELTADDYRAFAKAYMPTMDGTFHLGMLAETTAKRQGLERWKKELGADWDRLRVIITGPEGRLTAAHTRDTRLAGLMIRNLMSPANYRSQVWVAPLAQGAEGGLRELVDIAENQAMGHLAYEGVPYGARLYEGLTTFTENLAYPFLRDLTPEIEAGKPPVPDLDKWLGK